MSEKTVNKQTTQANSGTKTPKTPSIDELDLNAISQTDLLEQLKQADTRTPEEKEAAKQKALETIKRMYLENYHLEKVDLNKELELIKIKKSNLSRSQRYAVMAYFLMFNLSPELKQKLEEEAKRKDNEANGAGNNTTQQKGESVDSTTV